MNTTPILEKPLLRGHFHQAMFFVSVGACLLLIFRSDRTIEYWATAIYTVGVLSMFGISALYHRVHWQPQKRQLWRKLDHSGIYLMIAGTFTPVTLLSLGDASGKILLLTIWTVAIVGVLQSIFFVNIPKWISAMIYVIAGLLVLPYLGELHKHLGLGLLWLIIAGGIVYILGALSYAFKWPGKAARVFGYHELFHLLVSIAAILHFIVVYILVTM